MSAPELTRIKDGIVCPHCGRLNRDAWEWIGEKECGEAECGRCERPYKWSVYHETTYTAKPIAKEGE